MTSKKNIRILSIETSGATCGVALSENGALLADYSIFGRNLHDKMLAEFVRRMLADFDFELEDLAAVAVSAGPGSFTGLRIGAALAKGICFEDLPRSIAVPTLTAFAVEASESVKPGRADEIIALVPSHKDLIYMQKFNLEAEPLSEILQISHKELHNHYHDKSIITGKMPENAAIHHKHLFPKELSPRTISRLANKYFLKEIFIPSNSFIPLYIQEFTPK